MILIFFHAISCFSCHLFLSSSFFCIALVRTSSTVLNRRAESKHPCLSLDLRLQIKHVNCKHFFLFLNIFVFFPLPFSPLIFPSPHNHHNVVHVHESFFFFAQSLHPSPPTPLAVILLSVSLSLFCLLVQLFF